MADQAHVTRGSAARNGHAEADGGPLVASDISKHFGGVTAVSEVSLTVPPGRISGLIGPNGAGKSTMLALISGFLRPDSGSVNFRGRRLVGMSQTSIVRLGVARTFQQATPLAGLSVLENVLVGLHGSYRGGPAAALFSTPGMRRQERERVERARELLDEFGLTNQADADAADLPFGQLRFLEIARALATEPRLLLLDEPAAGLNRVESDRLADLISNIRAQGVGVLVVDHDIPFLFNICESITVMNFGRVIASGSPPEIENDPAVRAAYLSTEETAEEGETE